MKSFLVRPLQKHANAEHKKRNHMNRMHEEAHSLFKTAEDNLMKVNGTKTKVMLFNSSMKTDFEPLTKTPNGE